MCPIGRIAGSGHSQGIALFDVRDPITLSEEAGLLRFDIHPLSGHGIVPHRRPGAAVQGALQDRLQRVKRAKRQGEDIAGQIVRPGVRHGRQIVRHDLVDHDMRAYLEIPVVGFIVPVPEVRQDVGQRAGHVLRCDLVPAFREDIVEVALRNRRPARQRRVGGIHLLRTQCSIVDAYFVDNSF